MGVARRAHDTNDFQCSEKSVTAMSCVSQQTEAEKGADEMFNYIYNHAATCRETPGHVRMLHAAHAKDVYNPWMQLECARPASP